MSQCENLEVLEEKQSQENDELQKESMEFTDEQEPLETQAKESNSFLDNLVKEIEQCPDAEAKLHKVISFMEATLAQSGTPHFRSFWEARKLCLPLFKEHLQPHTRSMFWDKYSALSKEARRLKDLLNEQSAFAEEQIGIAIQAVEAEVTQLSQNRDQIKAGSLSTSSVAIEGNAEKYATIQYELDLLNAYASRVNALRKELVKTEMRVRKKNQFFQRLSSIGDGIFPRRKELIREISQQFINDVDAFIKSQFSQGRSQMPPYVLREEIKNLQTIAKSLTLNAQSFTQTRVRLSECWDKLKDYDKERKQQRAEKKAVFQQNADSIILKINEVKQEMESGKAKPADLEKKLGEVTGMMRRLELGREELQYLRDELNNVRKPLQEQKEQELHERQEREREKIRVKQEKFTELQKEVHELLSNSRTYDIEGLTSTRDALYEKINAAGLTKSEKEELERALKGVRDIITEKREEALLSLSDDDRQALQQLNDLYSQRKERRQEIKDQIEALRRANGASGLDFSQSMVYQQQLSEEKERLDQVNQAIEEVEEKIAELKQKL